MIESIINRDELVVSVQEPVGEIHRAPIDVVLDFGPDGSVVGLELMDPILRSGGALANSLASLEQRRVLSFSPDADVAYLSLSGVRPISQRLRPAKLVIDERDALARIEVGLEATPDYPE